MPTAAPRQLARELAGAPTARSRQTALLAVRALPKALNQVMPMDLETALARATPTAQTALLEREPALPGHESH